MSCNIPFGPITYLLASSNSVAVGSKVDMPNFSHVHIVKVLMDTPKSTNVFGKEWPKICTVTMGFPWFSYFMGVSLPNNKSDSPPTTWMVGTIFVLFSCSTSISVIFFCLGSVGAPDSNYVRVVPCAGEIIRPGLRLSSLHCFCSISGFGYSIIWIKWTNLLLGLWLGWAGNWGWMIGWGLC